MKRPVLIQILLALIILTCTAGCDSTRLLREAQEAFNQGAEIENRARLGISGDPASLSTLPPPKGDPTTYYEIALARLEQADDASLKRDGLWVHKRTLLALTHWKLGNHEQARETARQTNADAHRHPREASILKAIPALVQIDNAIEMTQRDEAAPLNAIEDELVGTPYGAISILEEAREIAPGHAIQVYLIQSRLSAYLALARARERYGTASRFNDSEITEVRDSLTLLQELLNRFGATTADAEQITTLWGRALGVSH